MKIEIYVDKGIHIRYIYLSDTQYEIIYKMPPKGTKSPRSAKQAGGTNWETSLATVSVNQVRNIKTNYYKKFCYVLY